MTAGVKKDKNFVAVKILLDKCPLSDSLNICHTHCNWWNGKKCTYPTSLYKKVSH